MSGHEYPSTHSDIQCGECGLYFHLDGELIVHRDEEHSAGQRPTLIMHGVISGGMFIPTSGWEPLAPKDAECEHASFESRQIGGGMFRHTCHDCGETHEVNPTDWSRP